MVLGSTRDTPFIIFVFEIDDLITLLATSDKDLLAFQDNR